MSLCEREDLFNDLKIIRPILTRGTEGHIDLVRTNTGEEMILKTIYDENFNFPGVRGESVLEKYKKLKEADLPVVPKLMVSKDERQILMTDMTYGNNKIMIDKEKLIHIRNGVLLKSDYFSCLQNGKEIIGEIYKISKKALEAGVLLHYDAYSILLDKETKNVSINLIDLGENSSLKKNSFYAKFMARKNAMIFIHFLKMNLVFKN